MNGLIETDLPQRHEREQHDGFRVVDAESANWALRKLKAIAEKQQEINDIANSEIERIKAWKEKELSQYENTRMYFEWLLTDYYRAEKEKDKHFKVSSPYGKIGSRKSTKWIYEDEQALIDYCNVNEIDAIKVKEVLDKDALKKMFKDGVNVETGEVIPGVRLETVESINIKTI